MVLGCVLALWLGTGCGGGTIGDGQSPDAQPDSQTGPVDASADAYLPPDATPPPDAPLPPDAPPPPPTCNELYGTAPQYILCWETPTTCSFNVATNGGNCNQLCAEFGSTCVEAYDNVSDPGLECAPKAATGDTCTTNRSTEICVCSR
jgi:hypothetical protein